MRKHYLALNCFLLAFGWEAAEVCLPTEMYRGSAMPESQTVLQTSYLTTTKGRS
jgi:hypothetical protein